MMLGLGIFRPAPPTDPIYLGRMAVDGLVREGEFDLADRSERIVSNFLADEPVPVIAPPPAVLPPPVVRVNPVPLLSQSITPVPTTPKTAVLVPEDSKIFGMDTKTFLIVAGAGAAGLYFMGRRH